MIKPSLVSSFEFRGHIDVEWYDVLEKENIPDLKWHQAYIIGNLNGKVPVVMYPKTRDNLPGGKVEPGESIEQAMRREVEEELNMKVVSWEPLGYQKCTNTTSGKITYEFRAYAQLEIIGEFINDPGGHIVGHKLVELEDINHIIGYGNVGDRLILSAKKYFV